VTGFADRPKGGWGASEVWGSMFLKFMPFNVCVLVAAMGGTMPAAAQLSPEWSTCTGNADVAWEQQVLSCTALAQSGDETPLIRAVAYYNRALKYRARGDNDRAIADYTEAIRLNPNYVNAYHNRGVAYHVKGDGDLAIADFSEAIRLNPSFAPAYSCRGTVYAGRKEYARAIADFSDAFRISSGDLIPEDCDLRGPKSNPMPSPGGCDLAQSPLPCARYGTLVSSAGVPLPFRQMTLRQAVTR